MANLIKSPEPQLVLVYSNFMEFILVKLKYYSSMHSILISLIAIRVIFNFDHFNIHLKIISNVN